MKIGSIKIFVDSTSNLLIQRKKFEQYFNILFYSLIIPTILGFPIIYLISKKGFFASNKLEYYFLLFTYIIIIVVVAIYNIKRSRVDRNYILQKEDNKIFINKVFLCTRNELNSITIQRMTTGKGASSYNVGIEYKNLFRPLCLDLGKEEAQGIASVISQYFDKEIIFMDGKMLMP